MRTRINLLALLVVAAGTATIAAPQPAAATYYNPFTQNRSCCDAWGYSGSLISHCCGDLGCYIKFGMCYGWN